VRESIRIATFRGIAIGAHWSVLVIAGLLTWGLATVSLPDAAPHASPAACWIAAVLAVVCFFAALLAHELAHSLVAQARGVGVDRITLWLFGGVAQLHRSADTPRDELAIAGAGPAVSVLTTLVFLGGAGIAGAVGAPDLVVATLAWLALVNGILAVFNVAPAAPLDGGRLLHALVWRRTGDRNRATRVATSAGRAFGYAMVFAGILVLLAGSLGGLWFALLGWFLIGAASAEATHALLEDALAGIRVREVMTAGPVTVPADETIDHFVADTLVRHHCSAFPVVDPDGHVVGLVTLRALRSGRSPEGTGQRPHTVGEVMAPLALVPRARPDDDVATVVEHVGARTAGGGRILVFDDDTLVGIVSPSDLNRVFELAALRSPHPGRAGLEITARTP